MGDDISKTTFDEQDYARFRQRMEVEMAQLRSWEQAGSFAAGPLTTGLELEAWLLESDGRPSPDNGQFLESLAHASVVPELAKFNFELNVDPQPVAGLGIERMQSELLHTWQLCGERAAQLNRRITCIGILPTVTQAMLCAQNMTPRSRFEALNRQVLRLRHGKPLRVQVEGIDRLDLLHHDVMLESAATSLQVHLKVPLDQAARYYNAFAIASSATVALAANAPLVFGKRLWHDSRIAMFEQAVDTGQGLRRVSFGEGYATRDFLALFEDKILGFPPLLPVDLADHPQRVPHLRLHNGTLWLWNRPLIGFEENGQPHIRIEHRVMSAGPTAVDMLANVSFSLGLAEALANTISPNSVDLPLPPEQQCSFEVARRNFYAAARHGLQAEVEWLGRTVPLRQLLLESWLPAAMRGLAELGVDRTLINSTHEVLQARTESGRTAAVWQLEAFERHGHCTAAVLDEYLTHQATKQPVHQW